MTTFPLNPTNGLTHSIDDRVWSWNGYAWEKLTQSGSGVTGPTGPTGPAGSDGGGTTLAAGAGITLSAIVSGVGHTLGIDPTALIHVNGVSSDAGITSGSIIYAKGNIYSDGNVLVPNGSRFGNAVNGVFRVATSELQLLPNSDTTNAFVATASLHYHNQKTQFKKGISADAGITANAPCNFLDNQVIRPQLKDYSETVNAIGSKSTSFSVDFEAGNVQTVTITGDCTISFSNSPASGKAGTCTLIITNGGAHTVTWIASPQLIKWPGNVAPALTASGTDIISFLTTDGGSTIYGFVGGLNFS